MPAGAILLKKEREVLKDIKAGLDAARHAESVAAHGDRVYVDTVELGGLTFHCHSYVDIDQV